MSLSESVLQSQIALNQNHIKLLHQVVEDCFDNASQTISRYTYYAGLNVDKGYVKKIKSENYKIINAWKREIAKYVKLQKALKAELKAVREYKKRSKIVEAFITQQVNKLLLEK